MMRAIFFICLLGHLISCKGQEGKKKLYGNSEHLTFEVEIDTLEGTRLAITVSNNTKGIIYYLNPSHLDSSIPNVYKNSQKINGDEVYVPKKINSYEQALIKIDALEQHHYLTHYKLEHIFGIETEVEYEVMLAYFGKIFDSEKKEIERDFVAIGSNMVRFEFIEREDEK